MVEGIILAGGKSTRMKQNKMLLDFDGHPLIFYTIQSLLPYVDRLIIVTGKYDQEIRDAIKENDKIKIIKNEQYEKGMFSSVLTGVKETSSDFLLIPGDCPFVSGATIEKILSGCGLIRVPRYQNKDGHPIFISHIYKEKILSMSLDNNLKVFREQEKYEIINVEDPNIVINLNTISDFINLKTERKIV